MGGRIRKESFLEMSSLGEEEQGAVSRIHTILDEDLGAGETAMDGSHVQRTFAFFALWKHGVCVFLFFFFVQYKAQRMSCSPFQRTHP